MYPNSKQLFEIALGTISPWQLMDIQFETTADETKILHLHLDFPRGSTFTDSEGIERKVYDKKVHTWRHLDFFQHQCYLHAPLPRILNGQGKAEKIQAPWGRRSGGFTLLFEAYVMSLIEGEMAVVGVSKIVKETDNRIWRIFDHYVTEAHKKADYSEITDLGVDETSSQKGHQYLTVGVDLDKHRVVNVVEGKGKETIEQLADFLSQRGTPNNQIKEVSIDMSPAFIAGVKEHFPHAAITFDRFHVEKKVNEAVNKVRVAERKECQELKGHKYTFLKNPENLSAEKKLVLNDLLELYPTIGEAYRFKQLFKEFWSIPRKEDAVRFLLDWCSQVEESKIEPMKQVAKMIRAHWDGIINYIKTKINNGLLEGINSKIQLAKRTARGFKNKTNFKNMILLLCGKLEFSYP
jgi:transposase